MIKWRVQAYLKKCYLMAFSIFTVIDLLAKAGLLPTLSQFPNTNLPVEHKPKQGNKPKVSVRHEGHHPSCKAEVWCLLLTEECQD